MSKITFDLNWEVALEAGRGARHNPSGCTGWTPETDDELVVISNASVGPRVLARISKLAAKCENVRELEQMVRRELTPCPRLGGYEIFYGGNYPGEM